MIKEAINEYLIIDGKSIRVEDISKLTSPQPPLMYEVIRFLGGIPLFYEMHIERWHKSAKLLGIEISVSNEEIKQSLKNLLLANNIKDGNIKLLQSNIDGEDHWYIYEMPHRYPTDLEISRGVNVDIYDYERSNPNAKVYHSDFRKNVAEILHRHSLYEVLLMSKTGTLPEGSKSNVFYIYDDKIITSPSSAVLEGVTRQKVLEAAKKLDIPVIERSLKIEELNKIQGCFLSGTSIGVLPVARIERHELLSSENKIIDMLKLEYNKMVLNDLKNSELSW
ncbi:MAG: aminotransferase class IV [Tissierellia bacterium]|nr:aminotransferase class IV [Tissierellia bacterium]